MTPARTSAFMLISDSLMKTPHDIAGEHFRGFSPIYGPRLKITHTIAKISEYKIRSTDRDLQTKIL